MNSLSKKNLTTLKWVSGGAEAFLGIPILGGSFIIALVWLPLFLMLAFHALIVFFAIKSKHPLPVGNIVGIGASILGFIPGLGMALHIVSAVLILMDASKTQKELSTEV
ncbi:hypothetical protein JOC54_002873 [Alkalihalobacillus xiaoxiensis]|uniref:DUF4190 domain-containing protein n=1 Tax=Shouchella xiaoxiensis TaxID=766895 RepID=A0ABS2SVQ9_9BACI|nr:hypothetical protein [Shouchella xiaoxiensis]MBM7839593.1 hypothetical protein [Shouchella xiaoxiensis]